MGATLSVESPKTQQGTVRAYLSEDQNGVDALGQALHVSREPVYIYDTQGKCIWVNRSGEELLEMEAKEVIGRFIFELFPVIRDSR